MTPSLARGHTSRIPGGQDPTRSQTCWPASPRSSSIRSKSLAYSSGDFLKALFKNVCLFNAYTPFEKTTSHLQRRKATSKCVMFMTSSDHCLSNPHWKILSFISFFFFFVLSPGFGGRRVTPNHSHGLNLALHWRIAPGKVGKHLGCRRFTLSMEGLDFFDNIKAGLRISFCIGVTINKNKVLDVVADTVGFPFTDKGFLELVGWAHRLWLTRT